MFIPQSIHTKIAFQSIEEYLKNKNTESIYNQHVPEKLNILRSCFVTLKTEKKKLRGCIGTIKPVYTNLFYEIINNAVSSAFFDSRFEKLLLKELNKISITVEVLSPPEEVDNISFLNPKIYGVIISDKYNRRGVLLPGIDGINTIEEQIKIIKRKAGIIQNSMKNLKIYRFKTEKFH